METITLKIICLMAVISAFQLSAQQCVRYDQAQCIQWLSSQNIQGINTNGALVEIKPKPSNALFPPPPPKDISSIPNSLQTIQNLPNEDVSLSSPLTSGANPSKYGSADISNMNSSYNSSNMVKIEPFDPTKIASSTKESSISIDDIRQFSSQSTYIQNIYKSYSQIVLQCELNKISLQLFDYFRATDFDTIMDPVLHMVLQNVQNIYTGNLKNSRFLQAFFRYSAFAKIYKIFYVNLSSIEAIEIDQIDAIVDLFHMEVFTSTYRVYSIIPINETTIESILNNTRTK